MNPSGPYVAVACICEFVMEEEKNRISLIRILDRMDTLVTLRENPTDTRPAFPLAIRGFVSLKSGDFVGKKHVKIDLIKPSGEVVPTGDNALPVAFEGGEHGVNIKLELTIAVNEEGLYWFNVQLDGELVTRIPLRITVKYQAAEVPPKSQSVAVPDQEQQEPHKSAL